MRFFVLLLICSGFLQAQAVDSDRSRFLSSPNGRTGTWAPYRLAVRQLNSIETLVVHSAAPGVVLTREVAVAGREAVHVVLPVFVGKGARVMVHGKGEEFTPGFAPELPQRRIQPDYARPYVAVFSTDPVYARGVLPSSAAGAVCDYYELGEFITDWRLLDGYDAVVIFNPAELRLPEGSQRAIAEFCSLGGATLVVGSFRLGEKAVDLPAPADAVVQVHRGVSVQRFGYGGGAIYRVSADDLRRSPSAQDIIVDALRDHLWFGADQPPAGTPGSRVAPLRTPLAPPLPPDDASPGPLFWALAGGLLLICGLVPATLARATRRVWPAQLALMIGCGAVGVFANMQERPLPALEVSVMVSAGEGQAESARVVLHSQAAWRETIEVNLDDGSSRELARAAPGLPGWNAWVLDFPLVEPVPDRSVAVHARGGMVGTLSFRDFGTEAHRGNTGFSADDAWLLDWWLEANAYRGRAAELAPVEMQPLASLWTDARLVPRGAIRVTVVRPGD